MIGTLRAVVLDAPDARRPAPRTRSRSTFDVTVDDVDAAGAAVLKLGATSLSREGENWRVYADPAGKPFCFCRD